MPADITADRFHVMKQVTDELDTARKTENKTATLLKNQSEKDQVLAGLTKSKYSLLKNESDLNNQDWQKLKLVQAVSPTLSKMHVLKEQFRDIFETTQSWGDSGLKLLDSMSEALSYLPKSIKTIVRWFG